MSKLEKILGIVGKEALKSLDEKTKELADKRVSLDRTKDCIKKESSGGYEITYKNGKMHRFRRKT